MVLGSRRVWIGWLLVWVAAGGDGQQCATSNHPVRPQKELLPAALLAEEGYEEDAPSKTGNGFRGLADSFSTVLLQHLVTWRVEGEKLVDDPDASNKPAAQGVPGHFRKPSSAALLATNSAVKSSGFPLAIGHKASRASSFALESANATALTRGALSSSTATVTATTSAAAGPVFFIAMCVLCAASVAVYLRSLGASIADASPQSPPTPTASPQREHSAKTDDDIGLSTPTGAARPRMLRRNTVTVSELKKRYWTIDDSNESMSAPVFVVNMFVDLCPPGLLPLAFSIKNTGYIPAFILLVVLYCLCVYSMYAISKSMQITGGKDFASQWTAAISGGSSWLPVAIVCVVCLGCNLTYSCFFADLFTGVMPALGVPMNRTMCLLCFTVFPTLPLCLLKNLSALSYSSSFAFCAVIYSVIIMVARAVDGTYKPGGMYYGDLPSNLAPNVPNQHLYGFGLPSLVLVNALATAFLSHYNGCKYYRELENHTPTKLFKCTATAMGICVTVFATVMVSTFQTFGVNADGVILKNYSEKDWYVNIARLVMGLSIIASFPLMFSGLREATITLLKLASPGKAADWDLVWRQDALSMVLLSVVTVIALVVTDAGLVVGIVGSVCGSAIIYIVPCTLYAGAIKGFMENQNPVELAWLRALTCLGLFLAIAGTYSSLMF